MNQKIHTLLKTLGHLAIAAFLACLSFYWYICIAIGNHSLQHMAYLVCLINWIILSGYAICAIIQMKYTVEVLAICVFAQLGFFLFALSS